MSNYIRYVRVSDYSGYKLNRILTPWQPATGVSDPLNFVIVAASNRNVPFTSNYGWYSVMAKPPYIHNARTHILRSICNDDDDIDDDTMTHHSKQLHSDCTMAYSAYVRSMHIVCVSTAQECVCAHNTRRMPKHNDIVGITPCRTEQNRNKAT